MDLMLAVFTHEVPETSLLSRKAGFPNFFPLLDQFIELGVLFDVECTTDTHSCVEKRTKIEIEVLFLAEHNEGPAFVFNHLVQEEAGLSHLLLGILDIQGLISPLNSAMPLYWLCYRHNNEISVVIEPGASLIHARLRAALAGLDQGECIEART